MAHSSRKWSIIIQVLGHQELAAAGSIRSIVGKERMRNAHRGSVEDHGDSVPTVDGLSHSHGHGTPTVGEFSHNHGHRMPTMGWVSHDNGNSD